MKHVVFARSKVFVYTIYYDMILSIQSEILCFVWLLISVENSLMEVLIINHFENTVLSFQKKHMNTNIILMEPHVYLGKDHISPM